MWYNEDNGGGVNMENSKGKASTRAKNKYNAANYDRITLVVPKGQKSTIQAAADGVGESINQYTNKALLNRMVLTEWPEFEHDSKT